MARLLYRSRRLAAVSVLALLAGVVALSSATRRPCLQVSTSPWHLWKAGYMEVSEGQVRPAVRTVTQALPRDSFPTVLRGASNRPYVLSEPALPYLLALALQIRPFRSPPSLS